MNTVLLVVIGLLLVGQLLTISLLLAHDKHPVRRKIRMWYCNKRWKARKAFWAAHTRIVLSTKQGRRVKRAALLEIQRNGWTK